MKRYKTTAVAFIDNARRAPGYIIELPDDAPDPGGHFQLIEDANVQEAAPPIPFDPPPAEPAAENAPDDAQREEPNPAA